MFGIVAMNGVGGAFKATADVRPVPYRPYPHYPRQRGKEACADGGSR